MLRPRLTLIVDGSLLLLLKLLLRVQVQALVQALVRAQRMNQR